MIRLGIIIVVLLVVFVLFRTLMKHVIAPEMQRRRMQRLEIENRELDDQLNRIRMPQQRKDKDKSWLG